MPGVRYFGSGCNELQLGRPQLAASFLSDAMSAIGPKRTSLVAPHMSAYDPKATIEVAGNTTALAGCAMSARVDGTILLPALWASGGQLLSSEEWRRRAEEADELARKSTDFSARRAYEESLSCGARWRNASNGISGRPPRLAASLILFIRLV
jgi:hypothetical protein